MISPAYKIRNAQQVFTIPIATSATEPGSIVIDLSQIKYHIIQYRITNISGVAVMLFKSSGGLVLIPAAGADPSGTYNVQQTANPLWRMSQAFDAFNYDLAAEGQLLLDYDFLEEF